MSAAAKIQTSQDSRYIVLVLTNDFYLSISMSQEDLCLLLSQGLLQIAYLLLHSSANNMSTRIQPQMCNKVVYICLAAKINKIPLQNQVCTVYCPHIAYFTSFLHCFSLFHTYVHFCCTLETPHVLISKCNRITIYDHYNIPRK